MNRKPRPGVTVRIVTRAGQPLGIVRYYDASTNRVDVPVEDEWGVTRMYSPDQLEPVAGPAHA